MPLFRLFAPSRIKDDTAKVGPFEFRVEQREHVVVHGSPGGLGLVAESIVKGVDDLLLEVIPARMCVDYRFSVGVGLIKVAKSENIISTPAVTRATSGFLCLGMPGVVCSAMASQTTSIRRALTS